MTAARSIAVSVIVFFLSSCGRAGFNSGTAFQGQNSSNQNTASANEEAEYTTSTDADGKGSKGPKGSDSTTDVVGQAGGGVGDVEGLDGLDDKTGNIDPDNQGQGIPTDDLDPLKQQQSIDAAKACVRQWDNSPFSEAEAEKAFNLFPMRVGEEQRLVFNDNIKSDTPRLVVLHIEGDASEKSTMNLLDPNGWYCVNVIAVKVRDMLINLDCKANFTATFVKPDLSGFRSERVNCP